MVFFFAVILLLFVEAESRNATTDQEIRSAPNIVNLPAQNGTANCTTASKRQLMAGNCADVTEAVQSSYHVNRVFHPHEPYVNDATPIVPIHAIDSIPWINDYQPINPIQNDNDYDDEGEDDDEDDRRNKIRNELGANDRRRVQRKNAKKMRIKNHAKHAKIRGIAKNRERRQVIFPIKIGSMLKNFIKRNLAARVRLLRLHNSQGGLAKMALYGGNTNKGRLVSKRGLVPMIPGKPKVEKLSLQPLKDGPKEEPLPAIPSINQQMQEAKKLDKEDMKLDKEKIKLQKLKDLEEVPEIKSKKQ